jgi:hypothetical protein
MPVSETGGDDAGADLTETAYRTGYKGEYERQLP